MGDGSRCDCGRLAVPGSPWCESCGVTHRASPTRLRRIELENEVSQLKAENDKLCEANVEAMNSLEKRIVKLNLTWIWTRRDAFTTIHAGFGFAVYYRNDRNWLAILTPEVTTWQLTTHNTKPPEIIGFWKRNNGVYTERMFEIPVTESFLVHVVESVFPEMLTLLEV